MSTGRRLRRRDEAGYAAVLVALLASTVFIGLAALGMDTARWYVELEKLQKAADSAALAGVTYMPNDLATARTTAIAAAAKNGYVPSSSTIITVTQGDRASQLRVTISTPVHNTFGQAMGFSSSRMTRSATADYTAPAPMGSPCNTFGNEPRGATGSTVTALPLGTALPTTSFANCPKDATTTTSFPQFWAGIEGPETDKVQGDRYQARNCTEGGNAGTTFGCASGLNSEYRADGTYFAIHVEAGAVGIPISLQVYDGEFADTGAYCQNSDMPLTAALSDNMNTYTPAGGKIRYAKWRDSSNNVLVDGAKEYCAGDSMPGRTLTNPVTTSFVLRNATETDNPTLATPVTSCIRQFRGQITAPSVNQLLKTNDAYNPELAALYHQWYQLCSFTPTKVGNYFLQVRTNVTFGGSLATNKNPNGKTVTNYISTGNNAVTAAAGNTTTGAGANSFSLRAVSSNNAARSLISVSGWERMPLLQNAPASTATFNLVRALPNSKGQYLTFDFFDAADGSAGTIKVLPPVEATGDVAKASGIPGCRYGKNNTAPSAYATNTTCSVAVTGSDTDGQVYHMVIPIPQNYTCNNATLGGCWFRVQMAYGGNVTDFTTWSANIGGDPVRLVK